jgi:hypothetical protein
MVGGYRITTFTTLLPLILSGFLSFLLLFIGFTHEASLHSNMSGLDSVFLTLFSLFSFPLLSSMPFPQYERVKLSEIEETESSL